MSTTQQIFKINGFVDTRNSVWDNIEKISSAASAWTTYDTTTGKWSVVINQESSPVKTFNDKNIIGDIIISRTPIDKAYTGGKFKYANRDIPGAFDSIEYQFAEIDTGKFIDYDYRREDLDNKIEITNELVNDYVQADVLLNRELKLSRRRTNIEFYTDYGSLDLRAGDVINVEADVFENQFAGVAATRKFRVIEIEETDGDSGEILLKITGVDYSDEDYELFGFERFTRTTADPMPPIKANTAVQEDIDIGNAANILEPMFEDGTTINEKVKENSEFIPELAKRTFSVSGPTTAYEGQTITYTYTAPSDVCTKTSFRVPYTITGVSATDIDQPLTGTILISGGTGSIDIALQADGETEGPESLTITVGCQSKTTTIVDQYPATKVYNLTADASSVDESETLTFSLTVTNTANGTNIPYTITGIDAADLASGSLTGNFTADWGDGETGTVVLTFTKGVTEGTETITMNVDSSAATLAVNLTDASTASATASPIVITEGDSTTVTLTTEGHSDQTVNYTISGTASGKVSSPALTGTVSLSSGSASLAISTSDDGTDDGYATFLTVNFSGTGFSTSAFVTVKDNDGAGNNLSQAYTLVPLIWTPTYNQDDDQVSGLSTLVSARVRTAPAVGTAVTIPTSVSVTKGNPSTVTVDTSITAYTGTDEAGHPLEFITTFNNIDPGDPVTGTTTTVRGY